MEERSWSRLAVAGVALAGAGLLVVFLAGFGYHHGWWSLRVAFGRRVLGLPLLGVLPIGTLLAMLGALLSLAGIAHALRAHLGGVGLGAVGLVVGVVPSVMVLHQYRLARTVPPINDISTDLQNPPAYVAAATNDFWKGKEMSYPAGFADSVRRGYPDLAALTLPMPAARAFGLAHRTATGLPAGELTGVSPARSGDPPRPPAPARVRRRGARGLGEGGGVEPPGGLRRWGAGGVPRPPRADPPHAGGPGVRSGAPRRHGHAGVGAHGSQRGEVGVPAPHR